MNNFPENEDFVNDSDQSDDLFLQEDGYECIWCGHVQTKDGICEYCGSYALESLNSESDYNII